MSKVANLQASESKADARIQLLFGFLIGLGIALPLLGRILGVPGRVVAIAVLGAALFVGARLLREGLRMPRRLPLAMLCLMALLGVLVLLAADASQWSFLGRPGLWLAHESRYREAKLLMFLLTFIPPMILAAMVIVLPASERAVQGMFVAFLALSLGAAVRVGMSADILVLTDYETARAFYVGENRGAYSVISYSLLFVMAAMAAAAGIGNRGDAIRSALIAVCLFMCIWLNQRADTIFLLFALSLFVVITLFWRREFRQLAFVGSFACALVAAGTLAYLVQNEVNAAYWGDGGAAAISYRTDFAGEALGRHDGGNMQRGGVGGGAAEAGGRAAGFASFMPFARSLLFGKGLGSFALARPETLYPHNLFIEVYSEIGPLAGAALVTFVLVAVGTGLFRSVTGPIPRDQLALWMIAAVIFLNSMKASDITGVGTIAFFMIVTVSMSRHRTEQGAETAFPKSD